MRNMKKIIMLAFVLVSVSCSGQYPTYQDLSPAEFAEAMKAEDVIVLDVRTDEELDEGMIEGAIQYNFYDEDFAEKITTLDRSKHIMVYCEAGGRAGRAATILDSSGFTKVSNLDGGIDAWEKAKLPLVVRK